MSSLSIRSLPKKIEAALTREAKRSGKSKSQITIEALGKLFHLDPERDRRQKIQRFFGKMSSRDFAAFQESTQVFETIDLGLWK